MKRAVSLGLVLPLVLVAATGCSKSSYRSPKAPSEGMARPMTISRPAPPQDAATRYELQADSLSSGSVRVEAASAVQSMPGVSAATGIFSGLTSVGKSGSSAPPPPPVASPVPLGGSTVPAGPAQKKPSREMLAVEAHVTVDVPKVSEAVARARALVAKHGGQLINDVFNDERGQSSAALSIRVPAASTEAFLVELGALGRIRERRVQATDVAKQFNDQTILLRNLAITLARYEELRRNAKDTKDLLAIEQQITRLRTDMERVESELTVLADRVDRSTIYLTLQPTRHELPEITEPEATIYPDLHGTYLYDLGDRSSFLGGGFGARISRHFGVDISGLRHLDGPYRHDILIATAGGEVYSDFLGGGRRKAGNVFLGARFGVLHGRGRTESIIPLTLGVELLHLRTFTIEARGRADIFFGSTRGAHLGVQPDLAAVFAF